MEGVSCEGQQPGYSRLGALTPLPALSAVVRQDLQPLFRLITRILQSHGFAFFFTFFPLPAQPPFGFLRPVRLLNSISLGYSTEASGTCSHYPKHFS